MADFVITLIDTGKHSTAASATVETGDYNYSTGDGLSNNGVAFTLNISSLVYNLSPFLGEPTYRNNGNPPEVNYGGAIDVPAWNVKGYLDMTTSAHRKIFGNLVAASKSRGYLNLGSTNTTDSNVMLRYYKYNDGSTVTTIIPVRINKLTFTQANKSTNLITYSLTLLETS